MRLASPNPHGTTGKLDAPHGWVFGWSPRARLRCFLLFASSGFLLAPAQHQCFALRLGATGGILWGPSWPGWGIVGLAEVLYDEGGSWVSLRFI